MKSELDTDLVNRLTNPLINSLIIAGRATSHEYQHIVSQHHDSSTSVALFEYMQENTHIRSLHFICVDFTTTERDLMRHILNFLNTSSVITSLYFDDCEGLQYDCLYTSIMRDGSNIIHCSPLLCSTQIKERLLSVVELARGWLTYKTLSRHDALNIQGICTYRHALKSIFNYIQELLTLHLETTDWSIFDKPDFSETLDQDLLPLCKDHLYKCMFLMHMFSVKDIVLHITFQHMDYALVSQTMKQIEAETSRTL